MTVINQKGEFTKKELASLTVNGGTSIKNLEVGTTMSTDRWLVYNDTNKDGEIVEIMAIFDERYETPLTTTSKTFMDAWLSFADIMGDEPYECVLRRGVSKNNREYNTCDIL